MNHQSETFTQLLFIKAQSLLSPILNKYKTSKEKLEAIQVFSRYWDKAVAFGELRSYQDGDRAYFTDQISALIHSMNLPDDVYNPEKMHLAKLELVDTLTIAIRTTVTQEPEKREAKIEKTVEMLENTNKFLETVDRRNRSITIDISDSSDDFFHPEADRKESNLSNQRDTGKKRTLETLLEKAGEEYAAAVKNTEPVVSNRKAIPIYHGK